MDQTPNLNPESSAILTDSALPKEERIIISHFGCFACLIIVFLTIWLMITIGSAIAMIIFAPPMCIVPLLMAIFGLL